MKDLLSRTIPPYLGGLCAETMHVFHFRWSPEIPIRKNQSVKEVMLELKNNSSAAQGVGRGSSASGGCGTAQGCELRGSTATFLSRVWGA